MRIMDQFLTFMKYMKWNSCKFINLDLSRDGLCQEMGQTEFQYLYFQNFFRLDMPDYTDQAFPHNTFKIKCCYKRFFTDWHYSSPFQKGGGGALVTSLVGSGGLLLIFNVYLNFGIIWWSR